ncbi:MAG: 8-amino-7-oxononanoate synthase [Bacteroidales bacterium]|nr:8-amino-7-oxononanoate synthase [Bacteroidales bacterium]
MFKADKILSEKLELRKANNCLRSLTTSHNIIDFCSNDYLGFSRSLELKDRIFKFSKRFENIHQVGSTGSRLISGNSALVESLESFIATYHEAEAGLVFNSGYDANLGLISSVPQRGDTIFYDAYAHASIRDAIRLGFAKSFSFKHNDIADLQKKMKMATGNIFIIVESVYSMDGDCAPLKDLCQISQDTGAHLIVDEAHATGVFGNGGKGLVVKLGLTHKVFARIHTFGKALGCHGAIVLGSALLRDFMINYSRSFIYTTALPLHSYIILKSAYDLLNEDEEFLPSLLYNIEYFRNELKNTSIQDKYIDSPSAIQCFIIEGNEMVKNAAAKLHIKGFDVKPIMSPTVPRGKERIRICLHSFNTKEEIKALLQNLDAIL